MRIDCPYCGERDHSEFTYLGAAGVPRADMGQENAGNLAYEAVYLRHNPAGLHDELWYHAAGCRCWVEVRRHTGTHEIFSVRMVDQANTGGEK